jgi:hypothetical protein
MLFQQIISSIQTIIISQSITMCADNNDVDEDCGWIMVMENTCVSELWQPNWPGFCPTSMALESVWFLSFHMLLVFPDLFSSLHWLNVLEILSSNQ